MASVEEALQELSRAPLASFVAERKRLAAERRAAGDEDGAARIAQRPKPVLSVWAVNQLYWQERKAFDAMLAAAERIRAGDRGAAAAHRDALADLRKRAAGILTEAGHAASDATMRRIATTLAAIAAAGGFEPDPPGALATDRDPPGFEAIGVPPPAKESGAAAAPRRAARDDDAAERRRAEAAERKRQEAERARRQAERSRIESALREAKSELRERERERSALETQLRAAERAVAKAQAAAQQLEEQLAELKAED